MSEKNWTYSIKYQLSQKGKKTKQLLVLLLIFISLELVLIKRKKKKKEGRRWKRRNSPEMALLADWAINKMKRNERRRRIWLQNCVLLVDLAMNPCKLDAKSHLSSSIKQSGYRSMFETAFWMSLSLCACVKVLCLAWSLTHNIFMHFLCLFASIKLALQVETILVIQSS